MRATFTTAATAFAALIFHAGVAGSGIGPVPRTGQTLCYGDSGVIGCAGTGQDGELQKGVARSFTDNGDGTITDHATGLMWEKLSDDGSIHDWDTIYPTWTAGFAKIAALNSENFAGHDDWRYPNRNELLSIANLAVSSPAIFSPFHTNCTPSCTVLTCACTPWSAYGTSTSYQVDPSFEAYTYQDYGTGLFGSKAGDHKVRAVRGGSSVLKTGQTTCFDNAGAGIGCSGTGQDGEFQMGVAPTYMDNGDGTITDNATGLMWEKQSDDGSIHDKDNTYAPWTSVFTEKIATLNSEQFAGYSDWRLPNRNELLSLVSVATANPATPGAFNTGCVPNCDVSTCSCTSPAGYWSSTTFQQLNGSTAWIVAFGDGRTDFRSKTNSHGARAVRGGFQTLCGNGVIDPGEVCDDGNMAAGDCCSPTCGIEPASTVCRAATGGCDLVEHCDGASASCPADALAADTTICRPAAGICDVAETCDGLSPACAADARSAALCRASLGICDAAEWCDGTTLDCPGDGFQATSTVCRAAMGICDPHEYCTGSSALCPDDVMSGPSETCRPSAGICDIAENCTGSSAMCPPDALEAPTTVCRTGSGVCDASESCTGNSASCPEDFLAPDTTVCRTPAGACDAAETCDGSTAECPADGFVTAGASSSWSLTEPMSTARHYGTATRLPDGRVLVAGGHDGTSILATAEIYDPGSGSWSPTGSMGTNRYTHTAILLPDGRVLVVGGDDGHSMGDRLRSAEIYDPSLGTWSPTGSMVDVRERPTATVLPDGRVLVTGGGYANGGYHSSTELYDPALGTWALSGSMEVAHYAHTATLLPDGRVLVAGGITAYWDFSTSVAEIFDPAFGTWTSTNPMEAARESHTATLLPNGRVLVAGGRVGVGRPFDPDSGLATAEIFDPALGTWSPAASMASPRHSHIAASLVDGQVLVAGGHTGGGVAYEQIWALSATEIYDPSLDTWTPAASMVTARYTHMTATLADGRVFVAAGYYGSASSSTAEIYSRSSTCRASAGPCDPAEDCDGTSPECPVDVKSTAVCRESAGGCDLAESCNGVADDCPADAFVAPATICRPGTGVCDPAEECTGSAAACPADTLLGPNDVCRPAAGACDDIENCSGSSPDCPIDGFLGPTVACRASAGVCDVGENCTGQSADCPADLVEANGTPCRVSLGVCDLEESCNGSDALCPPDGIVPPGTACGSALVGSCTAPDTCDATGLCNANDSPDGAPCDDGDVCTLDDECMAGICESGEAVVCDDANPCTEDSCAPDTGACVFLIAPATGCRDAGKSGLGFIVGSTDKMRWKWTRGDETTCDELGAPDVDTAFELCVYDSVEPGRYTLATRLHLPASALWEAGSRCGWKYSDSDETADGVSSAKLTPGEFEHAAMRLSARGPNLPMPAPVAADRFFAMNPTVTVQFFSSSGVCWQSEFSEAAKNSAEKFKTTRKLTIQ